MLLKEGLTENVIGAFYSVYNRLGFGFLEKVYENAMILELQRRGIKGRRQVPIKVYDLENLVGEYFADIIVADVIVVELKAGEALCREHEAQLVNYLKATSIELGLLFNFGKKAEFRRKIFENHFKKSVFIR